MLPNDIWEVITYMADPYTFNNLVRAIPHLGRKTLTPTYQKYIREKYMVLDGSTKMFKRHHSIYDFPAIKNDNVSIWMQHGKRHRDNDRPAEIRHKMNKKVWYKNGNKHRDYKPAVITQNLSKIYAYWYEDGRKYGELKKEPRGYYDNRYIKYEGSEMRKLMCQKDCFDDF